MTDERTDPSENLPDADVASDQPDEKHGEISRDEDTSGGPLSSGAGEGAGQGGPDADVPGGADEGA